MGLKCRVISIVPTRRTPGLLLASPRIIIFFNLITLFTRPSILAWVRQSRHSTLECVDFIYQTANSGEGKTMQHSTLECINFIYQLKYSGVGKTIQHLTLECIDFIYQPTYSGVGESIKSLDTLEYIG